MKSLPYIKLGLAVVLTGLVIVLAYRIGGWPVRVKIASVGSFSFSLSWVSTSASKNCVLVMEGKLLPKKMWRVCESQKNTAHLVSLKDLQENQTYRVMIYRGWRIYWHTLKTATTYISPLEPVMPVAAYGSVMDYRGKPVPGALVYVYPYGYKHALPEAVITNEAGNYAIDLSFFGRGIKSWVIEGGKTPEQWNVMVTGDVTAPFPPLEVGIYE